MILISQDAERDDVIKKNTEQHWQDAKGLHPSHPLSEGVSSHVFLLEFSVVEEQQELACFESMNGFGHGKTASIKI